MKEKIVQLMKSEGLTSSRLAEILDIQPSGVSHLVSGRNKPGFDLLQKILRKFPEINPDWLILDDEKMYREDESSLLQTDSLPLPSFDDDAASSSDLFSFIDEPKGLTPTPQESRQESHQESTKMSNILSSAVEPTQAKISQVIVLYDDGSCRTYTSK